MALSAATCLAIALGKVIRGATWSLLVPVSLAAVVCGWGLGFSRLNTKQAWASLVALGISGVFMYVAGLFLPLWRLVLAMLSVILRIILWTSDRAPVDFGPLVGTWIDFSSHAGNVLARFWAWAMAALNGASIIDPVAVALVWNLLLWLVGAWSGWQLRRNRQVLSALVPGGVVLALVIDYTRGEVSLVIVYLAILLTLMGIARNQWMQIGWQQRKVDYSESVVFETLLMVGMVTIGLVLSAAGTPSLSWRELLDKLRERDRAGGEQVAQSLGLEAPPNAANEPVYRSDGLPRQHLLNLPPEQLRDVVLVVSTGEIPPVPSTALPLTGTSRTGPEGALEVQAERYYWRAITYDVYTGAGWRSSAAQDSELPAGTPLLDLPPDYRILNQHIKRAPDQNTYVYWTGILAQADADIKIAWRVAPPAEPNPAFNGDMLGALTTPDDYTVSSYVPQIDAARLRTAGSDYPSTITRRYLRLPESLPERVLGVAREVTQAALTPYDRAVAIEAYLRSFPYTLEVDPPPAGQDVVDYFLFTAKQGYCDYYATAMVVLARAVGLPARIVVGYTSGEYDARSAEYIIRKENAHSWAEVYFSGYGWVEFEPTAGQPAIGRLDDESASGPPPSLPAGQQALAWLKTSWRGLITSLGGQVFIAGMIFIALFFLWQMGEIGFLHLIPSQRAISWMYSHMELTSSRLLTDLPGGHTPHQLQTALIQKFKGAKGHLPGALFSAAEPEIEKLVNLYVAQAFSPGMPERSQIKQGIISWTRLRWRLWVASRWIQRKS
jgi:transglutaminase-like putative cysteine protease